MDEATDVPRFDAEMLGDVVGVEQPGWQFGGSGCVAHAVLEPVSDPKPLAVIGILVIARCVGR